MAAQVPLEIRNPSGEFAMNCPITTGVPFPPGELASADNVQVLDEEGREVLCQAVATSAYEDGSVRWLLLDLQADVPPDGRSFVLEYGEGVRRRAPRRPVTITEAPGAINVTTGPLEFSVLKDRFNFIDTLTQEGRLAIKPGHDGGPYFVDDEGNEFRAALDPNPEVHVELAGPMRSVITARGWYVSEAGEQKCRFIVRIHAFAGRPFVKVFYTWLMTEDSRELRFSDIGFRVPVETTTARYGLDRGRNHRLPITGDKPSYLLQYDSDRYLVGTSAAAGGERSPGWLAAGTGPRKACLLAVRDFWQLFPKELEATPDGPVFHIWPAHGVADPDREVNDAMLQYLWFAHEGEVLDFQVPESYYTHEGEHSENDYRYVRSSKNANALGIAKTHELLVGFFGWDGHGLEVALEDRAALQNPPVCMASPEWMCASGVFGSIQPYSPEQFPEYEALMSDNFDAELRMQEFTRDYGMWNFGDGHTSWDSGRRRWSDGYRCWRNMHHGAPRLPWLLYVRSGDPKYLRRAVRNARHVLDIDLCHWTTPEFEALEYPHGKIKGALNDYKGLVHWHSGTRLMDYNSMTDFMLWYWHMTGDHWGLEVALDWGEAVKQRFSRPTGSRSGAGTMTALMELYKETLDPEYRRIVEAYFEHMTTKVQNVDGDAVYSSHVTHYWPEYEGQTIPVGAFPEWENYAPWSERYWEMTKSPEAERSIVMWADAYLEGFGDLCSMWRTGDYTNVLATAYLITGDEKYLRRGVWEVSRALASVVSGEDDELLAGFMMLGQTSHGGYIIQRLPYFMKALAVHGQPVEPDPLYREKTVFPLLFTRIRPVIDGEPKKIETVEAWVLASEDRDFTVAVDTRHSYDEREYVLTVFAPSGEQVARLAEMYANGSKTLTALVPADGETGIYRVTCARNGSYGRVYAPIVTDPPMPVAYPLQGRLLNTGGATYHFFVPEGATQVALRMKSVNPGQVSAQIITPEPRARVSFQERTANEAAEGCEVTPTPEQTGCVWTLTLAGETCTLELVSEGAAIPQLLFQDAYPADVCQTMAGEL